MEERRLLGGRTGSAFKDGLFEMEGEGEMPLLRLSFLSGLSDVAAIALALLSTGDTDSLCPKYPDALLPADAAAGEKSYFAL